MRISTSGGWLLAALYLGSANGQEASAVTFSEEEFRSGLYSLPIFNVAGPEPYHKFTFSSTWKGVTTFGLYLVQSDDKVLEKGSGTAWQDKPPSSAASGGLGGAPKSIPAVPLTVFVSPGPYPDSIQTKGEIQLHPKNISDANILGEACYFNATLPGNAGFSYSRLFTFIDFANETSKLDRGRFTSTQPYRQDDYSTDANQSQPDPSSTTANSDVAGSGSLSTATTVPTAGVAGPVRAEDAGLSIGAIIGIAVGCGVAGLLLITALIWFFVLHRRRDPKLHSSGDSYGTGLRAEDLIITKEASAGVDGSPHSPYSDDGAAAGGSGTMNGSYHEAGSLHNAGPTAGAGAGAGAAAAAAVIPHRLHPQRDLQSSLDQTRSYTPYSDHPSGHMGSPSTHTASVAPTDDTRVAMSSPTPGRATPHGVAAQYAHLVEEGMTEAEVRRLEEEERQLDAAIEQAARH
ncbi:hypothetical protein B0H63DRAFT_517689 [Podospora didyma]|uniref:Mid2 domain-containing protein n=1 Tax=Podospora didyma TaxID=330526 RepID=A0AAE0P785_9PEZI|nr:hypothetical protein B0H63DRAFT_517689 [Podospora didyma]